VRAEDVGGGLELNKTTAKKHGPFLIYILYAANPPDLLIEMHTNRRYLEFFADAYNDGGLEPILLSKN
jgi:hypothetical protein